jgi:hypothetical protein
MSDVSGSLLSRTITRQPLLVGIIIDVSSSMKRNWQNKDGIKLPRIKVIRDSLNRYLQEEKFKTYKSSLNSQVELFRSLSNAMIRWMPSTLIGIVSRYQTGMLSLEIYLNILKEISSDDRI